MVVKKEEIRGAKRLIRFGLRDYLGGCYGSEEIQKAKNLLEKYKEHPEIKVIREKFREYETSLEMWEGMERATRNFSRRVVDKDKRDLLDLLGF